MGWEVVAAHRAFAALAPHRRPLRTVLGYSSGAIPTILSGRMPEEHGHWALFPRALAGHGSPFAWTRLLRVLPRRLQHRYRVRRLIREATRRSQRITGYFQIYDVPLWLLPRLDYAERHDLWRPRGMRPAQSVLDVWQRERRAWFCSGWQGDDAGKFARAEQAAAEGADTLLVYATELDALMHRIGTGSPQVGGLLRRYEQLVRSLMRKLEARFRAAPETWIFSDHGMTDTIAQHDLMARVAALPLREGRDFLAFYDSTMARFWIERAGAETALVGLLRSLDFGELLGREELARNGLAFQDRRYGDLIFLMQPGHLIAPSYMGEGAPRAMHGFHPDDPASAGAILSPAPLPEGIAHIRDLFGLMTARA